MKDLVRRPHLLDELLRRFASALRAVQLYSSGHPLILRNIEALIATLGELHAEQPSVAIGILQNEFVIDDTPLPKASASMSELMHRLQSAGVERVTLDSGVTLDEASTFLHALAKMDGRRRVGAPPSDHALGELPPLPHIRVGRIQVEERVEGINGDIETARKLYNEAVVTAETLWTITQVEGRPDMHAARKVVESLAAAVAQNRTALTALTALKDYDNYTFTHMVNVSILTMGQARGLGIEGPLLHEFGLSALMHDIGKVRTPPEVLKKADKLTDEEFAIMKRHTIDGAEILRRTSETPTLAPIVAFEHHLRSDGTGYPEGVTRSALNLCTMLCSIADVYDAMRSQRLYQQSFPTDRILAVLQRNDGRQFDQHLVRRFTQLIGIYPPGNLVRLNTGEIAVVVRVHAPDPFRPKVRVIFGRDGNRLALPNDLNLWEIRPGDGRASVVVGPLDPAAYAIDPLSVM